MKMSIISSLPSNMYFSQTSVILTWVIIVCVILYVFIFVLTRLAILEKKLLWGLRTWSTIIFGFLIVAVLVIHCLNLNNTDANSVKLIDTVIIPVLVGLVSSFAAPWVKSFFKRNYVPDNILPAVPNDIYAQSKSREMRLTNDLKNALQNSDVFYYSGVGMTVASDCIQQLCNKGWCKDEVKMFFIVPYPDTSVKYLLESDKNNIKNSIKQIINGCKQKTVEGKFTIQFIFLKFIPSFHIHLTDEKCWFAFVDKGLSSSNYSPKNVNADNQSKGKETREKYPTTYCYCHDLNKLNDNIEMYVTIKKIILDLINRHQDSSYTFHIGNEYKDICKSPKIRKLIQNIINCQN